MKELLISFSLVFCLSSVCHAEYVLDDVSRKLAFCGSVFAYAGNWFLLQNNEGAAKLMVLHQSRADVALLSIHYDGRVVPGERVRAFKTEGQKAKPFLDANLSKLGETIDSCAATTNSIVSQRSAMGISMWGKTFAALVEEVAAHLRSTLGIR